MLKDAVAVLDVGSARVTAIIGERAVNNNFAIRARSDAQHEAFDCGKIIDIKSYRKAVVDALNGVCASAKAVIDELYIGVPGDFIKIVNRPNQIFFNRKKRIKNSDVNELYDGAAKTISVENFEIIDHSALYFFIDGNTRVAEPIGEVSTSLRGTMTYFLCDSSFIAATKKVLSDSKIKKLHFISTTQAESMFLFSRQERCSYAILVDCGYISTSISIIMGDGMLYHGSFAGGGGYVEAYLCDRLKIAFPVAGMVKRKINLSLNPKAEFSYEVYMGDEVYNFDAKTCNEIVKGVLDEIAENICKHIRISQVRLPSENNAFVSLTGGGISFIRGAKEYLAQRIDMSVNVVAPEIPFLNKPNESSKLSLLNYALTKNKRHNI